MPKHYDMDDLLARMKEKERRRKRILAKKGRDQFKKKNRRRYG